MNHGNAGKGRPLGARNKLTRELLELAGDGLTPVEYCLDIMRNEEKSADLRLTAARIVAPYLHPKPTPSSPTVEFAVPEDLSTAKAVQDVHSELIKATAAGSIPVAIAKDISGMLETQRRVIETTTLEERVAKLEEQGARR